MFIYTTHRRWRRTRKATPAAVEKKLGCELYPFKTDIQLRTHAAFLNWGMA